MEEATQYNQMKGIDVDKRLVINEVVYIVAGVDILGLEHEIVIYVYK
jgi:hypothetical protein